MLKCCLRGYAVVRLILQFGHGDRYKTAPVSQAPTGAWRGGEVANTAVCRTAIQGCNSPSRLQESRKSMTKEALQPQKKDFGDKALEAWGKLNKITLTAEGITIVGGLIFGVPWLVALAAGFGVADLGSDYARSAMQQDKTESKRKAEEKVIYQRSKLGLAA